MADKKRSDYNNLLDTHELSLDLEDLELLDALYSKADAVRER